MDRTLAQDILIAIACCSVIELRCYDCPLYGEDGRCRSWSNEEVVDAVRTLQKDGDG